MSNAPLNEIDSFKIGDSCKVLDPKSKRAFKVDELKKLEIIYKQLYPNKQIESISHFYTYANKATMNNEIIGSVFSRNKKASVIGAYWPHEGSSLECIDYTKLLIGTIQNFIEHKLIMKDSDGTMLEVNHLFCYVKWLIPHPEHNWFGNSVTVSYLSESDELHAYSTSSLPMCTHIHETRLSKWNRTSAHCHSTYKKLLPILS